MIVHDAYLLPACIFRMDSRNWANDDGCDDDKMDQNCLCRPNTVEKWYEVRYAMDFALLNDLVTMPTAPIHLSDCSLFDLSVPFLKGNYGNYISNDKDVAFFLNKPLDDIDVCDTFRL